MPELSRPSRRSAPSAWRRTGGWLLPVLAATIIFAPPFALTAEAQTTLVSTGAAIHNLGEEAPVVSCQLMKDGAVLEEEEISLEANGQEARYIEEMFTSTDTSDFVGSVRCTAPTGEGMFTGVAVELDASNQIFTTLPVVPVPERMSQE